MRHVFRTALWVLRHPTPTRYKRELFWDVMREWQAVRPEVVRRGRPAVRHRPSFASFASRDYESEALRRRANGNALFRLMMTMRRQEQAVLRVTPPVLRPAVASLIAVDMTRHLMRQAIADRTWPQPEELQPKRPLTIIDAEATEVHLLPPPPR